jgi:uncharacterized membrane protein
VARVTKYEASSLVWITGAVMMGVAIYENSQSYAATQKTPQSITSSTVKGLKSSESLLKQLLAIALLMIVMSIVADQTPEFGKPFSILVLVAFLTTKTPIIKTYFKQTQGSTK